MQVDLETARIQTGMRRVAIDPLSRVEGHGLTGWLIVIAVVLYLIFGRRSSRRPWEPGPGPGAGSGVRVKSRFSW